MYELLLCSSPFLMSVVFSFFHFICVHGIPLTLVSCPVQFIDFVQIVSKFQTPRFIHSEIRIMSTRSTEDVSFTRSRMQYTRTHW